MDLIDLGAVLVAIIAAFGAWASQRSAAKASKFQTTFSSRMEAERGAYERARAFDTETILRQDTEIGILREANAAQDEEIQRLRDQNERLRRELAVVKRRVTRLESVTPEWERLLNERTDEADDQEQ